MKKLLLLAAIIITQSAHAQIREGYVKYKTSIVSGDGSDMASTLLGNSSLSIYFKSDRSLSEMVTPLYSIKTLTDNKGTLMLMDGAGEKIFTRTPPEIKVKGVDPVVTITNEKKKILGYDCVKAIITTKDKSGANTSTTVWYTDKIVTAAPTGFVNMDAMQKLKGLPLEINVNQGPLQSKIAASEISLKPVADAVFILSTAGYTEKKINLSRGPK